MAWPACGRLTAFIRCLIAGTICTMAADNTPDLRPDGGTPPRHPPVGRVSSAASTVRVNRAAPAQANPVTPRVPGVPFTPVLPATPVVSAGRTITTRLAAAATTARRYQPPAPLTNPLRHPRRWLAITAFSV